jgi:hypothetical protein
VGQSEDNLEDSESRVTQLKKYSGSISAEHLADFTRYDDVWSIACRCRLLNWHRSPSCIHNSTYYVIVFHILQEHITYHKK